MGCKVKLFEGLRKGSYYSRVKPSPGFKNIIPITVGFIYWFFLAISSGMIEYYRFSLAGVLSKTVGHIPKFIYYQNFGYFLIYGGLYWFPTYHIGITLPVVQFTLSVFLSVMVALVLEDTLKIGNRKYLKKGNGISLGGSMLSLISTTGACCSLPFVYYALSLVTTTSTSFGVTLFFSSYSYFIDEAIIIVLAFIHFRNRRLADTLSQNSDADRKPTI